ncbi:MAG TPA: 3-dehydroquinate synthase [Pyrinomonadaceae bacterium]|nr:3-dehydroquinate synthase [Pyrinomonadaceae bacterium]
MPLIRVRTRSRASAYEIKIGCGILADTGKIARHSFGQPAHRVALISNKKVFSLYGLSVVRSLEANGFAVSQSLIPDGERYKTLESLARVVEFLSRERLSRSDGVVALGGGVVGDLAGFAAAIYLRGIPYINIPTTLLAQIDSSIGGKTGVNVPAGKNLIGSFHQPAAVITDVETLRTLPPRELTAGWCETVKQAAVASRKLFKQTTDCLISPNSKTIKTPEQLVELIASHCAFKSSIVEGDEREAAAGAGPQSRRILNFGHTIGHALESVTRYKRFRHGEAVGHGVLVAGELSKNLGLLAESELKLLRNAVGRCGPLPPVTDLAPDAILNAIGSDKKRVGENVQWVLLERIGKPRIVDGKEIDPKLIKRSLSSILKKRR